MDSLGEAYVRGCVKDMEDALRLHKLDVITGRELERGIEGNLRYLKDLISKELGVDFHKSR